MNVSDELLMGLIGKRSETLYFHNTRWQKASTEVEAFHIP